MTKKSKDKEEVILKKEQAKPTKNLKKETDNKKKISKKKKVKNKKKGNIFTSIGHYFKEVVSEMHKVRWPNKKEMLLYSGATLGFVIIFATFFMLNDVVISAIKQLVR